jgi:hypothetical protein
MTRVGNGENEYHPVSQYTVYTEKEHNDRRRGKVKKNKDYPLVENVASDIQESYDLL